MADLEVQPRKRGGWGIRILIALIIMFLLFFFLRSCNQYQTFLNGGPDSTNVSE
ncbi:hypothetical protein [Arcticibacter pallidicorallinus]|uniref:hypothetical protein n=1 Tax=Arcticibacter pallidicorallinus TaxID=1259464 RepID=UPI0015E6B031|nr:hypothetical protein [Arcticibacter pallidicorallinus]